MDAHDFCLQAAKDAGALVLELRQKTFVTSSKGGDPRNIVTSVDLSVNDFLLGKIKAAFPDDALYSEESGGHLEERTWAIDPIDGSSNFSRGIPHFAICIALVERGAPAAGAVHNPMTGETFSFIKGGGAFLNGSPIAASPETEISKSFVLLHAGRKESLREWGGAAYQKLLGSAKKTSNLAGSALDTCFVAAGRVEASIYGTLATLDIAAAAGVLREAGGVMLTAAGQEAPLSSEPQKIYAANNHAMARALIELLES